MLRPLAKKEFKAIAAELELVYKILGYPKILQCDRGTEFQGKVKFCQKHPTEIRRSEPYHPQSQGKIERSHSTWTRKIMQKEKPQKKSSWPRLLPKF